MFHVTLRFGYRLQCDVDSSSIPSLEKSFGVPCSYDVLCELHFGSNILEASKSLMFDAR